MPFQWSGCQSQTFKLSAPTLTRKVKFDFAGQVGTRTRVYPLYNKRFKVAEPLTRLKNHIQKLKITYRAFDKIKDSSGAPGVNTTTGMVHADKEWWEQWIKVYGNKDAVPIKNNGFPAYQAVSAIIPAKHLQANGHDGFGTQSKKRKEIAPVSDGENKNEEDDAIPSKSDSIKKMATDRSSDSLEVDVKEEYVKDEYDGDSSDSNPPPSSGKGKATVKPKNKKNPFARHLKIAQRQFGEEEEETPELKFVRSKRGPVDRDASASTSTAKRARTSGPKLISQSIDRAVELEEQGENNRIKIAKMKLEQHPKRQEAMEIFNRGCKKQLKPEHIIIVANKLKDDDTASFFCHMSKEYQWEWLKSEAGVLEQYQDK